MSVRVRELSKGEGLLWRDLRLEALAESPDAFAATYENDAYRPDSDWHEMIDATAADSCSTSLVAEVEAEPVGMAFCRMDRGRGVGELFAMWVRPSARRCGAGRALLEYALGWMRSQGGTSAELTVTETNTAAVQLYVSSGFVDTGRRESLRRESALKVIAMQRDLISAR